MTRHAAERDILDAAEALFGKSGYGDVSLRQLIAAAGVSTTAFYARFDSKDAVLDALTTRLFTELHAAAITTLRDARDLAGGIDAGVELLVAQFAPRKALVRLILTDERSIRRRSYALLAAFLASRLRALADRGRIHAPDPDALAWALVGALEIQIVRWAVWDELDLDQLAANLVAAARAILPKELT